MRRRACADSTLHFVSSLTPPERAAEWSAFSATIIPVVCHPHRMLKLPPRPEDAHQYPGSYQIRMSLISPVFRPFSSGSVTQEPRKSDAPQLRDEFRSYRTLNGTRRFHFTPNPLAPPSHMMHSRCTTSPSLWSRGAPQCSRHRPSRPQPRGPL
jgi:hypothetical protein